MSPRRVVRSSRRLSGSASIEAGPQATRQWFASAGVIWQGMEDFHSTHSPLKPRQGGRRCRPGTPDALISPGPRRHPAGRAGNHPQTRTGSRPAPTHPRRVTDGSERDPNPRLTALGRRRIQVRLSEAGGCGALDNPPVAVRATEIGKLHSAHVLDLTDVGATTKEFSSRSG